ncbi:hypothetical protein PR001_g6802 [Phytophthora rubi]|uniref:Uncharacterized protein n=1 Tax=Phytophthora rubi TaxID=129364 RepID=A0A6A3N6M7_9STRA|nr:hypothetical protein PR001_g6802 [Phytophthora rubi]
MCIPDNSISYLECVHSSLASHSEIFCTPEQKKEAQHRSPTNDAVLGFVEVESVENPFQHCTQDGFSSRGGRANASHTGQNQIVVGFETWFESSEDPMIPADMAQFRLNRSRRHTSLSRVACPAMDSKKSQE